MKLRKQGLVVSRVGGDGNCLFRVIADQLEGDEDKHAKYREAAVKHMKKNPVDFDPFIQEDQTFDQYMKKMAKDGTWGG